MPKLKRPVVRKVSHSSVEVTVTLPDPSKLYDAVVFKFNSDAEPSSGQIIQRSEISDTLKKQIISVTFDNLVVGYEYSFMAFTSRDGVESDQSDQAILLLGNHHIQNTV